MGHYDNARERFGPRYVDPRLNEQVSEFLSAVYSWMGAGLAITAITAWFVASSPQLTALIAANRPIFWVLVIAQVGVVFVLSARVGTLAPATASLLFIAYSALTGVTLSLLLLVYTGASIASTFLVAAAMFGALAVYGTVTHRDLTSAGQFFFMGLIGIVLASIVNIFWQNDGLQFVVSAIGVIVFTGLTAYDAQRLRIMALALPSVRTGSTTGSTPVDKRHSTKHFAIQNARAHLLIVGISVRELEEKVSVKNQFDERTSLEIGRSVLLAVPSAVRDWKPA